MVGGRHCPHTGGVLFHTYPPSFSEYCCWCGDKRVRLVRFVPLAGHGPFLDGDEGSFEDAVDPWTDECPGRHEEPRINW